METNLQYFTILKVSRRKINPTSQTRTIADLLCKCGKEFYASFYDVQRGKTKSCGCLKLVATHSITHGLRKTREYRIWSLMKDRCLNDRTPAYKDYGGRGIKVCDRWLMFENFIADMGFSKPKETIDRIKNDGDYEPGNCRWATMKEQCNNRRSSRILEYNGEKKTLMQWAEHTGIHWQTIRSRIHRSKWSIEKSLTTSV